MIHTINKLFWGNSENINLRAAFFSIFSSLCFGSLLKDSFSLLVLCLGIFAFILIKYVFKNRSISLLSAGTAAIFLALFTVYGTLALSNQEGKAIRFLGVNPIKEFLLVLGVWIFFFFLISSFFIWMSSHEIICYRGNKFLSKYTSGQRILILAGVIFICYLSYLFAFYPGVISNDSFNQIEQVLGIRDYASLHPIAHTFLIWICFKVGHFFQLSNNACCAIYSISQMLFMSLVFAFLIEYLIKKGAPKWVSVTTFAFFALFPLNGFYAITMWKDFIFACFVVLMIPLIIEIVQTKGEWFNKPQNLLYLGIVLLGAGIFRSNAIIVVILMIPLLLLFIKNNRIKYAIVALSCVAILGTYQYIVLPKLNIRNSSNTEMLAVPLSQLCRVAAMGRQLTDEQERLINDLVGTDVASVYNPAGFDDVKFNPHYNESVLENNKRAFAKMWFSLGIKYPLDFMEAHLCAVLGYWYPDIEYEITDAYVHTNQEGIYEAYPVPQFSNYMKANIKPENYYYNSFLRGFVSAAYPGWICIVLIAYCFYRKRKALTTIFFPILAVWISVMCSAPFNHITRYTYSMFIALPLLVFICISKDETNMSQNKTEV